MIRRDAGRKQDKKMLVDCVDLDALEREARRVMRSESWVFCDTGADDEITARENIAAWRALKLRPRMLRDIVDIDTGVTLLGARWRRRSWWRRPGGTICFIRKANAPPRAARPRPARSM
jgi:hypothetical protein